MKIDSKDVCDNLPKKGFRVKESKDLMFYFEIGGLETGIKTKISKGPRHDIGPNLVTQMRVQLRLDKNKQVVELCNCTMSEQDYIEHLKKAGHIQ